MTKLTLTLTVPVQLCVLFSYKLCACHMTGCHYIQPQFHSGCAPFTECLLSVTSGFCHTVDENCSIVGYYAVSGGNLLPMFRDNLSVPFL